MKQALSDLEDKQVNALVEIMENYHYICMVQNEAT